MIRRSRKRALVAKVITVAGAACGLLGGYLLGSAISIRVATNSLDRYARLTEAQADSSFVEARSTLKALKDSPYPYCSDVEIAYFRGLVSHSQYLKEAGRIHGGKIDCTTTGGHQARSIAQLNPDSRLEDGTVSYSDFRPMRSAGLKKSALLLGTAYVAFGSELPASPGPYPIHISAANSADYTQSNSSAIGSLASSMLNWTADGTIRVGNTLYETRCSTLHTNCITASASVSEASQSEYGIIAGCTVVGGELGILCGMAFTLAYRRRRDMCQQLRRAVHHDELQVVYQPIVVLSTRQIVGAEALARWTDEEGNSVGPEVFVKVAEEHGFVGALTKSVLHHALEDFARILQSRPGFRLSINAAGADLVDPEFLPMLEHSLQRAKVGPESIVIEISEKSAASSETAMETIRTLRRKGHSIHIDDFGTGYSNLDKLLYLFADTIKIDKAFTSVIGTESVAAAILPQILAMAKSLNLEVVVEGVETDNQADYFSPETPHLYGQGWLYGRPVAAEAFNSLLAENFATVLATQRAASHAAATQQPEAEEVGAGWISKPGALHLVASRVA